MAGPATKTLQNVPGPPAEWQTWNAFKQIKGGRAKDFEVAITWLKDAGLIYKIRRVPKIEYPLKFYEDFDVFKVFPLDVGLLGAMTDVPASQMLVGDNIFKEFKGAFTECYVNEQLARIQIPTFYHSSNESECEIDFAVQTEKKSHPNRSQG